MAKKALLAPAKLSGPENLGSTASSETFSNHTSLVAQFHPGGTPSCHSFEAFYWPRFDPNPSSCKASSGLEVPFNHRLSGFNLRWIKPYLTDSPKGPWELVWHAYLDYFGEDQYNTFVWGKVSSETVLRILIFIQKW